MRRNTAGQVVTAQLNALADGTPVTGGTTTITVTKDGTGAAGIGTITHINAGLWKYIPTQAETNAEHLVFTFSNALAATQSPQVYTEVDVNVLKINSDATAALNLENQYNTTGLVGDKFPATQEQVSSLATGAGGISTTTDSISITTGTEVNTYTNTFALDGAYHTVNPSATVTDFYYEFDVGREGKSTEIIWDGYVQANGDILNVYGYNWVNSTWIQIGSILGANGTTQINQSFITTSGMTGTGSNAGKVRVRFSSSTATSTNTDRILCTYTVLADTSFILHAGTAQAGSNNTITLDITASPNNSSYVNSRIITKSGTGAEQENIITDYNGTTKVATVKRAWVVNPDNTTEFSVTPAQVHCATAAGGYNNGAVYVDVVGGSAGTQIGVNGTADNPCLNLSDAKIVADTINVQRFIFDRGAGSPVLDQSYEGWRFDVRSAGLFNLNGQNISGSIFNRAFLTGIATSTSISVFEICGFISATLPRCNFVQCGFNDTIVLSQTEKYMGTQCFENSQGIPPTFDINGNNLTKTELVLDFKGRVTITGMTSVDVVTITGNCEVTLDAGNTGGVLNVYGDIPLVDTSTGVTINKGDVKATRVAVEALNDFNPATTTVNIGAILGTPLVETTSTRIASNLSTFFDNSDSVTVKVVDDVGTAVSGGGEFTPTEKAQMRYRLGLDGTSNTPTATPSLSTFKHETDVVARVTLVDTTTTNTDMRGTNNALLTANYTSPDNAGILSIEAKVDGVLIDTGTTLPNSLTILDGKVNSVLEDTGTTLPTLLASLENLSAAEVKAELINALSIDATVEPTSVPSSTASIAEKLSYIFAFSANKISQTSSTQTLRNNTDSASISVATLTTDGVTTSRGKHI